MMPNKCNVPFCISVMTENCISSIKKIEDECFLNPWAVESIINSFNNDLSYFIVAKSQNRVIGYAGMYHVLDEGYIYNIAVLPGFRGAGIGTSLIENLEKYSKEKKLSFLSLEVRESNKIAINLYKKLGFVVLGNRKNFYTNPTENGIIMTKYF